MGADRKAEDGRKKETPEIGGGGGKDRERRR